MAFVDGNHVAISNFIKKIYAMFVPEPFLELSQGANAAPGARPSEYHRTISESITRGCDKGV